MRLDVQTLGADFVAVSGHKMCGPSGIGFLWGRGELLLEMSPFLLRRAHDPERRRRRRRRWGELPAKFEAGTSPIAEAVGLGAAIDYLEAVGLEAIEAHEHALVAYALDALAEVPGIDALRAAAGAPRRHRQLQRRPSGESTRTTWRRSSTSTGSRSAPATTAASR